MGTSKNMTRVPLFDLTSLARMRRLWHGNLKSAALVLGLVIFAAAPARAIDAVSVRGDVSAIDLTAVLDHQRSDTDRIQVSIAPGTDGIVRRIEVRAREGGQNWIVFAPERSNRKAAPWSCFC